MSFGALSFLVLMCRLHSAKRCWDSVKQHLLRQHRYLYKPHVVRESAIRLGLAVSVQECFFVQEFGARSFQELTNDFVQKYGSTIPRMYLFLFKDHVYSVPEVGRFPD